MVWLAETGAILGRGSATQHRRGVLFSVVHAKVGTHVSGNRATVRWVPAFAGTPAICRMGRAQRNPSEWRRTVHGGLRFANPPYDEEGGSDRRVFEPFRRRRAVASGAPRRNEAVQRRQKPPPQTVCVIRPGKPGFGSAGERGCNGRHHGLQNGLLISRQTSQRVTPMSRSMRSSSIASWARSRLR